MKIKKVLINFENLDEIIIPYHYFSEFSFGETYTETYCSSQNEFSYYSVMKAIKFILKKSANEDAKTFSGDVHLLESETGTLFERIQFYQDIVSIKLFFHDMESEDFFVEWQEAEENEYCNTLQESALTERGDLCVIINEKQLIDRTIV